jgi:hypothetical protein
MTSLYLQQPRELPRLVLESENTDKDLHRSVSIRGSLSLKSPLELSKG